MEYNKMIYIVFKAVNKDWKFVRTFFNKREAQQYIDSHKGYFYLQERETFD